MRVSFVISSLGLGGAERTMSIMANYWAAKGWQITLICLDGEPVPFYDLATGVRHVENLARPVQIDFVRS